MFKGTSRADRTGFIVVSVLACLLALVWATTGTSETESAQEVATFADLPEPAAPAAIEETEVVAMPTATPTPAPIVPLAAPIDDEPEPEEEEVEEDAAEDDSSTADGASTALESVTDSPSVGSGSAAAQAPAAESSDGDVPNPQPAETAVPNPQPAETAVPNPQPAASAVPNPQPATATQNISAPPPAAQGGTFTHTLTATVSQPTLHTSPGGPQFMPSFNGTALPPVNPTVFGNPLVYRVTAGTPDDGSNWAQVYVPARPNGTTAWVNTSQFTWGSSNRMIQINVSNNTVTVFEGSNVLVTTAAVTGKSSSRTPVIQTGWVEEIMAGPSSAYGPRLISLGLFSNDLNSFGGSVPKIALHGTNNPSLMGQYASNGCIRIPNDVINQIAGMMPAGSKVQIVG